MRTLLLALLLSFPAVAQELPPGCAEILKPALVYTRQPRAVERVSALVEEGAAWQHTPDGGRPRITGTTDLVLDRGGKVTVIHDCTTSQSCAATEGRVSPDGKRIAYSVLWPGHIYDQRVWGGGLTGQKEFLADRAEIWIYEVATGKKYRASAGHMDRFPDWLSNDTLVLASDRDGTYAPWSAPGNYYPEKALHIFKARLDSGRLTDFQSLNPSDNYAISPAVFSDGRICWSAFEGTMDRGIAHTPNNMWWIKCSDGNGADVQVVLGAHGSPYIKTTAYLNWLDPARPGEGVTAIRLLGPVSEIRKGYAASGNYYRGNHQRMGMLFGWEMLPPGIEGVSKYSNQKYRNHDDNRLGSGRYIPSTLRALTPYGTDGDTATVRFNRKGQPAGAAGYPAPYPGKPFMFTHNDGWCYEAMPHAMANRAYMKGPTCKKEIRVANVPIVTDPFDPAQSEVIACPEEHWQCWDARAVTPYQILYSQPEPKQPPAPTKGECALQVVDARAAELSPIPGGTAQDRVSFQGRADPLYPVLVTGFMVTLVEPWAAMPPRYGFKASAVDSITPLEADGSLKVSVPCETPLLMSGVDKDGNVIAHDAMLHSLREGETRTCFGCHDGHSEERAAGLKPADVRFKSTIAGGGQ